MDVIQVMKHYFSEKMTFLIKDKFVGEKCYMKILLAKTFTLFSCLSSGNIPPPHIHTHKLNGIWTMSQWHFILNDNMWTKYTLNYLFECKQASNQSLILFDDFKDTFWKRGVSKFGCDAKLHTNYTNYKLVFFIFHWINP